MPKFRFAVVGCGKMGMRRIQTIRNHPETELACVCDNDGDRARKAGQDLGVDRYTQYSDVVARQDVDCVVISGPNAMHVAVAVAALKSGKHVFCEKPLARNEAEGVQMVEAGLEGGVTLKVGSNLRHFPSVQKTRELLRQGALGQPLFLRGWIGNGGEHLKTQPWFSNPELSGGGTFLDNGCHLFDLSRWFLGEVKECQGTVATNLWPIPVEDNGMGLFTFSSGAMAFIQSSWTEWVGYMYMEIYGSEGSLRLDNRGRDCKVTLVGKDGKATDFDYADLPPRSYADEFKSYISALQEGRQPRPSGFDGLRAVQMAHGVYRASREGRRVGLWAEKEDKLLQLLKQAKFTWAEDA